MAYSRPIHSSAGFLCACNYKVRLKIDGHPYMPLKTSMTSLWPLCSASLANTVRGWLIIWFSLLSCFKQIAQEVSTTGWKKLTNTFEIHQSIPKCHAMCPRSMIHALYLWAVIYPQAAAFCGLLSVAFSAALAFRLSHLARQLAQETDHSQTSLIMQRWRDTNAQPLINS